MQNWAFWYLSFVGRLSEQVGERGEGGGRGEMTDRNGVFWTMKGRAEGSNWTYTPSTFLVAQDPATQEATYRPLNESAQERHA